MLSFLLEATKDLPIEIVVVGSEGKISEDIAKSCRYVEAPNIPLTNKMNAAFQACKDYEGVILLGSDDLMSKEMLNYYVGLPSDLPHVLSLNDIYFYRQDKKKLYYFHGRTHGAGRYYSKAVLEKINYNPYSGFAVKGLDTNSRITLQGKGIGLKHISMADTGGILVDVKYQGNITSEKITYICKEVNTNIMAKAKLPKPEIDKLPPIKNETLVDVKKVISEKVRFKSNGSFFQEGVITLAAEKAHMLQAKGYGQILQ